MIRSPLTILLVLFAFLSCSDAPINFKGLRLELKDKNKHVLQLKVKKLPRKLRHRFDTFFRNRERICRLSGSFLISRGNKVYQNSFGKRASLSSEDIQTKDVFQIASVSKFITALCITRLMQDSIILPIDTIQKYIPTFKFSNITIHQLLTHTSGLPEYTYLTDSGWLNDTMPKSNKDAVELLSNTKIAAYYSAGSRFDYCNSNYMLLAYIAEKATGKSFAQLVSDYIKVPAGLDSIHIYDPKDKTIDGYQVKGMRGDHSFIPDHQLNHIYGDKSVFINCFELFKIYKAFRSGLIVNQQYIETMLARQIRSKDNQYYGYGIRSTTLDNGENWNYHNGWWRGYRSYFWFNMKNDECIVVLTNRLKCGFLNTRDLILLLQNK